MQADTLTEPEKDLLKQAALSLLRGTWHEIQQIDDPADDRNRIMLLGGSLVLTWTLHPVDPDCAVIVNAGDWTRF